MEAKAHGLRALRAHWQRIQTAVERWARLRLGWWRDQEEAEDLTQEALCLAWEGALRCIRRGKRPWTFPLAIARYALRAVLSGRRFAGRMRSREALDQRGARLPAPAEGWGDWLDQLAPGPDHDPAALVAGRIDVPAWLERETGLRRHLAAVLAAGATTGEAARLTGRTAGAVSQQRRKLLESWKSFHGPEVFPLTSTR